MQSLLRNFILLLSGILFSTQCIAGPAVKLCIEDDCKKPLTINITDACWSDVKAIFKTPFSTDKDEQDNAVNAISLIEFDIYHSLAQQPFSNLSADKLYKNNSNKNHYKNLKNYMNVLLDKYLIKRHFMRKIITQPRLVFFESNALLIQSLTDSQLYIIKINDNQLGNSPILSDYKKGSVFSMGNSSNKIDETIKDDDFE
jgi:hypothetical protein